jgi:hypothetical protein
MKTQFIIAEIDLQDSPIALQTAIETELKKYGDPLRWAVTQVSIEKQKAYVEAIVTTHD